MCKHVSFKTNIDVIDCYKSGVSLYSMSKMSSSYAISTRAKIKIVSFLLSFYYQVKYSVNKLLLLLLKSQATVTPKCPS